MDEQKKRLVELIDKADTEVRMRAIKDGIDSKSYIAGIADYLLANGVLVPPCKVGDVIFCHTYDHKEYASIEVRSLGSLMQWVEDGDFGKWLFLTREEAEAALKKDKKRSKK